MSDPLIDGMKKVILDAGCVVAERNWIDLDHIWTDPHRLAEFAEALADYLTRYKQRVDFTKMVIPIKVFGPFGILPFVPLVSARLDIPLMVWKEFAKPATGESLFYGFVEDSDRFLILHDVLSYGGFGTKLIGPCFSCVYSF